MFSFRNKRSGFTLLELVVVVAISAILTTIILVNFQSLRVQQQIQVAGNDMISKIREVQNFALSGKIVSGGEAADYYEIVFTYPATTYVIHYNVGGVDTVYETITLPQNMQIDQLTVQGNPDSLVTMRIVSPYSNILVEGAANQTLQIRLNNTQVNKTKTVTVDGISGRITAQ